MKTSNRAFWAALFLLLALALLGGCGDDDCSEPVDDDDGAVDDDDDDDDNNDDNDDDSFFPADLPGPYHAGAFAFSITDSERDRFLPVTIWYPTDQTWGESMTYLFGLIYDPGAIKDAAIAKGGPFPLIVFSHGISSFDFQSFSLMTHLASHGYIVAAVSHLQSTALTYIGTKYFSKSAMDRPQDVSALIDTMLEKNRTHTDVFFENVDPTKIGIVGHSMGGYTAIASLGPDLDVNGMIEKCDEIGQANWTGEWHYCNDVTTSDLTYVEDCHPCSHGDDRILASVAMAPAFPQIMVPGSLSQVDVPVLVMGGDLDATTPPMTQNYLYFEGLPHPDTLFWLLEGATHYSFSSVCEIDIARRFFDCEDDILDTNIAHDRIWTATAAYLGLHVKGDDRYRTYFEPDYLSIVPEVTVETKR